VTIGRTPSELLNRLFTNKFQLVRAELDESICVQGAPGTGNPNPGN
jgi:hypothetical protein